MNRYLYSLSGLILFFGLFFFGINIQIQGQPIIVLQPFFPVFIYLLPVSILLISFLRRRRTIILFLIGVGVFALLTAANLPNLDFKEKGVVQNLIVEVFAVLAVLQLSCNIAHLHEEMEQLIQTLVIPTTKHRILNLKTDQSIIENEFYRGRRFNYPISTMVLNLDNQIGKNSNGVPFQTILTDLQGWIKDRYVLYRDTKLIDDLIRKSDLIVKLDDSKKLLLICPDTPLASMSGLAARVKNKFKGSLDIDVVYGVASFPQDGTTFHALVSKAEESLNQTMEAAKLLID